MSVKTYRYFEINQVEEINYEEGLVRIVIDKRVNQHDVINMYNFRFLVSSVFKIPQRKEFEVHMYIIEWEDVKDMAQVIHKGRCGYICG